MKKKTWVKLGVGGLFALLLVGALFFVQNSIFNVKPSYGVGDVLNVDFTPYEKGVFASPTFYDCSFLIGLQNAQGQKDIASGKGDVCTWGDCFSLRGYVLSVVGENTLKMNWVCREKCDTSSRYSNKVGCQSGSFSGVERASFSVVGVPVSQPSASVEVYCFRCESGVVKSVKSVNSCPSGYSEDESVISSCKSVSPPPVVEPTPEPVPSCLYSPSSVCEDDSFVVYSCNDREVTVCGGGFSCGEGGCVAIEDENPVVDEPTSEPLPPVVEPEPSVFDNKFVRYGGFAVGGILIILIVYLMYLKASPPKAYGRKRR